MLAYLLRAKNTSQILGVILVFWAVLGLSCRIKKKYKQKPYYQMA